VLAGDILATRLRRPARAPRAAGAEAWPCAARRRAASAPWGSTRGPDHGHRGRPGGRARAPGGAACRAGFVALPAGPSCLVRQGYLPALTAGALPGGCTRAPGPSWAASRCGRQARRCAARVPVDGPLAAGGRRDGLEPGARQRALSPQRAAPGRHVVGAARASGYLARSSPGATLLPGARCAQARERIPAAGRRGRAR
jgi:hypothetical protein